MAIISTNPALRLEPVILTADFPSTVLPVIVHAPEPFILINLWAHPARTYEAFTLRALLMCAVGVSLPVVVVGDFNSSPAIPSQRVTSPTMFRRLREEFGLVSAYHSHLGAEHGHEPHPTFYMNRKQHQPFHIDYCWVPESWRERITVVDVGNFDEWRLDSDHRPLIVQLEF